MQLSSNSFYPIIFYLPRVVDKKCKPMAQNVIYSRFVDIFLVHIISHYCTYRLPYNTILYMMKFKQKLILKIYRTILFLKILQ